MPEADGVSEAGNVRNDRGIHASQAHFKRIASPQRSGRDAGSRHGYRDGRSRRGPRRGAEFRGGEAEEGEEEAGLTHGSGRDG